MKVNSSLCDICGTCVAVCPVDAISVEEFSVNIDREVCTKCLNCKNVCPIEAIGESEQKDAAVL